MFCWDVVIYVNSNPVIFSTPLSPSWFWILDWFSTTKWRSFFVCSAKYSAAFMRRFRRSSSLAARWNVICIFLEYCYEIFNWSAKNARSGWHFSFFVVCIRYWRMTRWEVCIFTSPFGWVSVVRSRFVVFTPIPARQLECWNYHRWQTVIYPPNFKEILEWLRRWIQDLRRMKVRLLYQM